MRKIVINRSWASFSLSQEAIDMLKDLGANTDVYGRRIERDDLRLIEVVEKLGGIKAKNGGSEERYLKIVSIPDDVDWTIDEYDGKEWVAEKHRTWGKYDDE